jgi:hypothetical protein
VLVATVIVGILSFTYKVSLRHGAKPIALVVTRGFVVVTLATGFTAYVDRHIRPARAVHGAQGCGPCRGARRVGESLQVVMNAEWDAGRQCRRRQFKENPPSCLERIATMNLTVGRNLFGVPPSTQSIQLKGTAPASGAVVGALANHFANVAPSSLFGDWQCRAANRRGRQLAAPEAGALPNAYRMDWA